jgi:hypothetical protein
MAVSTVLTVNPQEVVRESGFLLSNSLKVLKSGIPDYSSKFANGGSGVTVKIAKPTKVGVSSGSWDVSSSANADRDGSVDLTMSRTPITVSHQFTDDNLVLDFQDFQEQIVKPSMARLSAEIEKRFLAAVVPGVSTFSQAAGLTSAAVASARRYMVDNLCPEDRLKAVIRSSMTEDLTQDTENLFNAANAIGKQNTDGVVGRWGGFDFMESTLMPVQTSGSRAAGTISTTVVEGNATMILDIGSGTETVKAGEVFTVVGRRAVNDQTKDDLGFDKRWVVTADATASGGIVTVTVTEAVYAGASDNRKNVTSLPTAADTIVWVGAASSSIQQGLFFDPMFAATAFGSLPVTDEANGRATTVPGTKIKLRFERQKNTRDGITTVRWDVLPAFALVEPAFACRFFRTASTT